jgi:cobalt-zinc-cadmium efflux system membrane fusion protein
MAAAQGKLLIANREWTRVQALGRKVVSEQRFIEAQVAYQQGIAKLLAYGMTQPQIDTLLKRGDATAATGHFDLLSQQQGTVIADPFLIGQNIEPGQKLMAVSDESVLWVKAQINPETQQQIDPSAAVRVNTGNQQWVNGKIVQIHRQVDETTRTLPIRIEILNRDGLFYPGQFARVGLQSSLSQAVLAVPKASVTRLYGEQMVFVLNGNALSPQLVETGETRNDWIEIKAGLTADDEIVTQGTFLLKSMLLKSQIGDAD